MNAYGTKVSKSKMGAPRFVGSDEPANSEVKTYNLSPEELKEYLQTHELPNKKKRDRPKKMNGEQAQALENTVTAEMLRDITQNNLEIELKKLEEELAEVSQNNVKLQQELDDLLERYNRLSLDYEKAQELSYELSRLEGQLQQSMTAKRETEEVLIEETNKREALERLVRLYV